MLAPTRLAATLFLLLTLATAFSTLAADRSAEPLPADRIEQLVAPIALYPDALVAQILMASTYPLDIVQAKRWLDDRPDLKGEALDAAVKTEPWDASVKALVYFPSVLGFMSDNLDWTQDLGDAVLSQEKALTDTIQRLRRAADKTGALASNPQQRVEKAGDTIVIQPAQPQTVYVPVYDPDKVYGQSAPPATRYYPDAYADASASYAERFPSGTATTASASDTSYEGAIGFGAGALVGGLLTAAIMWDNNDSDRIYYGGPGAYGGGAYWSQPNYWNDNGWRNPSNIQINRNVDLDRGDIAIDNDVRQWQHNPERRGGVRYRDQATEQRFAAARKNVGVDRDAARGRIAGGERRIEAPDLGQVRAEAAASGQRRQVGDSAAGAERRAGASRAKIQERPAAAPKAKAKPRVQPAAANKRPVNREAKRPAVSEIQRPAREAAQIQRPTREAAAPRAQRPASGPRNDAFRSSQPRLDRAASQRGGASRAAAGRAQAGGARGGGGRGRGR